MKKKHILLLVLILVFSWLFFNYRLLEVPPGINGDEATIGYNAALVSRTGHDQNGRFLPLFVAIDQTDWKQPVTFYATTLAFKIFGASYYMLRVVSVIFVLISALLIFLLAKEILSIKAAFLSLFIFFTIPAVLIQSHLALENIAPVPFVTLWLWMLARYRKQLKDIYLYLSALFLGIGLFTYPGMRLIVPVFTVLTIIFVYFLNKRDIKKCVAAVLKFTLVILIFPIFMLSIKNQYPGAILAHNRPQEIQSYQEFLLPFISSFDPSFLFIEGDSTPYHSTGRQGVFLLATLPLFALGTLWISKKKEPMQILILLVFFLTPLFFGLAASVHRGSRLLAFLPAYTIITTLGFLLLFNIKNKIRLIIILLVVASVVFNYIDFVRDYWFEYSNRVRGDFGRPFHLVFSRAEQLAKETKIQPFIQSDFRVQNTLAVDFFEQIHFPSGLTKWSLEKGLPKSGLVIVNYSSDMTDLPSERIEGTNFGILISK